ncbi:ATP-binding protein, partial [Mesorhizobium sp. M1A.F.Ca.IN.020.03.1.1]
MTKLADIVKVERRFALSARIDTDLNGTPPLTGYVLQASVRKSLMAMLTGIAEGSQYAFTWTGPYGGGKSCAALLVANLVAGNKKQRALAEGIVGPELVEDFSSAFPGRGRVWDVLALTGRRTSLTGALAEAAAAQFDWPQVTLDRARDERVLIDELEAHARNKGGLLIVIDELGKFLEHATGSAGDVHILQDLAERAARSNGRLVVVGILHQSFEQYANRLSRIARNEWAKVQGRYQNVPFVAQADEVAALIARAIGSDHAPVTAKAIAARTAEAISHRRPVDVAGLTEV